MRPSLRSAAFLVLFAAEWSCAAPSMNSSGGAHSGRSERGAEVSASASPPPGSRQAESEGQRTAQAPATCSAEAEPHDSGRCPRPGGELTAQVATALEQWLIAEEGDSSIQFEISFQCAEVEQARRLVALRAYGYGGSVEAFHVERSADGRVALAGLRLTPSRQPSVAGPPEQVETAIGELGSEAGTKAFERIGMSLRARAEACLPTPAGNSIFFRSVRASSTRQSLAITLSDAKGRRVERRWAGASNNLNAPDRAPLELVLRAISEGLHAWSSSSGNPPGMGPLLVDLWPQPSRESEDAVEPFLELAAVIGSPELAERIAPALESKDERLQILAVNALAKSIGKDLRRGRDGELRPLPEIVAAYRRELEGIRARRGRGP